jgi:carbon monoxide dehydrogenase subunit G
MIIEGTYTLQAAPEDVWHYLMNEQVLRRAIPGLERLDWLDEKQLSIALHINQRPLLGTIHGKITVIEEQFPAYYAVRFEGASEQTSLSGEGIVHLSGRGENTVISYKSILNLGKTGSPLPSALVKGITKLIIQQFFTALADTLRPIRFSPTEVFEYAHMHIVDEQPAGQFEEVSSDVQPTFLHTLVHQSGLGDGDPLLEELWVNRVKRYSMLLGLLFLVWIGTRLPRRFAH